MKPERGVATPVLALMLVCAILLPGPATAGGWGVPTARTTAAVQPASAVALFEAPMVDIVAVQAEDRAREQAGEPPRFAIANPVRITPETDGTWERLPDGALLWRLRIESPGALSLNLGFTGFRLPDGAQLSLYPALASAPGDTTAALQFDARDDNAHGQLWTPVVLTDQLVVELTLPYDSRSDYQLELGSINVGYRFFGEEGAAAGATGKAATGAKSGACNVDVVCPVADPWRVEIPSVGLLQLGGSFICTGFLVNNTAQDQRPLLMTANHCGVNQFNAGQVVMYWNFQSPVCGQHGGGSLAQFQSGSTFRASYPPSDFTLVELDNALDPAFNLSLAGWDRGPQDPAGGVVIHHPSTDEKSISFDSHALETTSYYGTAVPGDSTHLRVIAYDLGSTEPGSSGSPWFDTNHHVVGQLHGGDAACGNDLSDYYGRLFRSWTGAGTANTRLSDWLDPLDTGATSLNTLAPWAHGVTVLPTEMQDARGEIGGPFVPGQFTYRIRNLNLTPVSYQVGATVPWLTATAGGAGTIPGNSEVEITVAVLAGAAPSTRGIFTGTVTFTNTTDHQGDTIRVVQLQIGPAPIFSFDLDTDPGWNTTGQWAFGRPTGGSGDTGGPDPTAGHTGQNVYGYNLNGGYGDNIPKYDLTTTALDCRGAASTQLKFWRWLGVEDAPYDNASVQVSNDRVNWTTVYHNTAAVNDTQWQQETYDIAAIADNQPTVYIRWGMGPTDNSVTYCGWNIDDIEIWALPVSTAQLGPQPNPIEPDKAQTGVVFEQSLAGTATLSIYDVRGRLIRRIGADLPSGRNVLHWDGRDHEGRKAAGGTYLYRLEVTGQESTGKMTLVR